ncbi:hypothetical protein [Limosilactobacillus reuteri]|uniref:Uncharacterized protein n=1 Tax=Limosilactobacillus reuteri TaxID=1598 RepID=A0A256VNK6_LIMRT|nr:hypothetical protein [Limosilactobacillus reuteri]OYS60488.1 hypothetical protein CBF88_02775 [Limosilactobacillus reuteri]OYS62112.1 hypothetical protein CBF91_02895 [Limosilactobacillus reuteri]OYS65327.1 hypothetical protein CBF89_02670 [Limosilactobacillus reuteri]OYS73514.1 hypothetical protein CBG01_02490 [Limosilactobacillus reuteri]OYS75643.1 hypothetical protein CBG08_03960 [Limosilactobacillus reuteri]
MKIKEAIEIINGTTSTVSAEETNDLLYIYHRNLKGDLKAYNDWFLEMPIDATNWDSICSDWDCLSNIEPRDLARVMDVIQQLLDTPVEERFPEKKYRLRWINDQGHYKNYLNLNSNGAWVFVDDEIDADIFAESGLEQLKKDNPRFAPAIDTMKEEVKDDE